MDGIHPQIAIRAFESDADALAFKSLNEEWITRHFTLELKDRETLNDPRGSILARGGSIFLAYADGIAVGCVALIPMGGGVYELSKMAVSPELRGTGIGRRLVNFLLDEARTVGATSVFLGSSSRLPNAVHLYESMGFQHVPPSELPPLPYVRADVFMKLEL